MAKKNENKENIIETEKTTVVTEVEEKEIKERKIRDISVNEYIEVRSVTEGGLIYIDERTKMRFIWNNYGSTQSMTFDAILAMNASHPIFLTHPFLVIDDKDVVEKLHIGYVYDEYNFEIANDLDSFFQKPVGYMRDMIRKLPSNIKENLKIKSRELYNKEILSDLNKIKMLEDELQIDLSILADDYR